MSVLDYVGRQIDLLAYQGGTTGGEQQLVQELAYGANSGRIITGIYKLSQRFLLELLTERGTMLYLPDRGCDFMTEAREDRWRNALDIQAAFSAAATDVTTNLTEEESDTDPDDERFGSAELTSVSFVPGDASLTITVTSLAGTSRQVILPLSVLI